MATIKTNKRPSKPFHDIETIHGVDRDLNDGEFVVFVGPIWLWQIHAAALDRRA